jgi:hypothetical protein
VGVDHYRIAYGPNHWTVTHWIPAWMLEPVPGKEECAPLEYVPSTSRTSGTVYPPILYFPMISGYVTIETR